MSEDRLLDVREAAALLSIQPGTVYDWVRLRKLPHYKIGGAVRFKRADLDHFLDANRRGELSNAKVGAA